MLRTTSDGENLRNYQKYVLKCADTQFARPAANEGTRTFNFGGVRVSGSAWPSTSTNGDDFRHQLFR